MYASEADELIMRQPDKPECDAAESSNGIIGGTPRRKRRVEDEDAPGVVLWDETDPEGGARWLWRDGDPADDN